MLSQYVNSISNGPVGAFCWIDPAWVGPLELVPTFMAIKGARNDFLRRQALDALSFGVAQKEALACLYLIEEGPHEAHYTSMGEFYERSVDPFHCLVFGGKGPLVPALSTWFH